MSLSDSCDMRASEAMRWV